MISEYFVNLFYGKLLDDQGIFDTGKLKIRLPVDIKSGKLIAIEATQIVLSRAEIDSSMRNRFKGIIKSIDKKGDHVQIKIEAGEIFKAMITGSALSDLQLGLGDIVWVSFKSSAVKVL